MLSQVGPVDEAFAALAALELEILGVHVFHFHVPQLALLVQDDPTNVAGKSFMNSLYVTLHSLSVLLNSLTLGTRRWYIVGIGDWNRFWFVRMLSLIMLGIALLGHFNSANITNNSLCGQGLDLGQLDVVVNDNLAATMVDVSSVSQVLFVQLERIRTKATTEKQ